MIRLSLLIAMTLPLQLFASAIKVERDIPYVNGDVTYFDAEHQTLDVYYPKERLNKRNVIVFLHGGSWRSGDKHSYKIMAKNFVRKGFIAVIVNYRLSPAVTNDAMAEDGARAVQWVHNHIAQYGGDNNRITLAGHSAGGQLAALIFFQTLKKLQIDNLVKKVLLVDAFGLDMVTYFKEYNNDYSRSLSKIFSDSPENWKSASPLYAIHKGSNTSFLVLTGSKTFPTIIESSKAFHAKLLQEGIKSDYQVIRGKKHIGMIIQFFFRHNKAYKRILPFLEG